MTATFKKKLVLGQWYQIKIKVAYGPQRPCYGPPHVVKTCQLIDIRSNGKIVVSHDYLGWDRGITDPDKRAIKKSKLIEVSRSGILTECEAPDLYKYAEPNRAVNYPPLRVHR